MPTEAEEIQAKEFLKRAEIRTMRKDLLILREADSLKERYKIVNIKTLEEQKAEQEKQLKLKEIAKVAAEKIGREEVLQKNEGQERIAEKDLKNYATEEERQQIFLLESQRLNFEEQIDLIDKKKDPALKMDKNKLLLQKRDWEAKLVAVKEDTKKLNDETNFLSEKISQTKIPSEKKSLEQRRWEIEDQRKEVEKKTWEVEKQIEEIDKKINIIDKSSEGFVAEKNGLKDKVLGIDKSLREIYSVVMAREEEKRRGQSESEVARKEALSKVRTEEKEKVQRQQWAPSTARERAKEEGYLSKAPESLKKKMAESAEKENEQRTKFMHDVETLSQVEKNDGPKIIPPTPPVPKRK